MEKVSNVQRYVLNPLSKIIIKIIRRFQLFKLVITLLFLGGFLFCYMLLDFRRCGLIPRNIIPAGLFFYGLDLTQHLITFNFSDEIVHKIFTKHHPYKLEAYYTLKITFTVIEVVYFFLTISNVKEFNVCPQTNVFITSYVATYASITLVMLLWIACCGEIFYRAIQRFENISQDVLHKAFGKGTEYIEDYVEDKLEPLNMIMEGRDRITRKNKEKVLKDHLLQNYEMLEF